jgi:hypothetical protein
MMGAAVFRVRAALFGAAFSLFSGTALAGSNNGTTILRVAFNTTTFGTSQFNGVLLVLNGSTSGSPGCATGQYGSAFIINPNTPAGAAAIAAVLTAQARNGTVDAVGTGACTISSGVEDLAWITLSP